MARRRSAASDSEAARIAKRNKLLSAEAAALGLGFAAPSDEQLADALGGVTPGDPFFHHYAWWSDAAPGGDGFFFGQIRNPKPLTFDPVFATLSFQRGPLDLPDLEWPYLTSGPMRISAAADGVDDGYGNITNLEFRFDYQVPAAAAPRTTHFGAVAVWSGAPGSSGEAICRAAFWVRVRAPVSVPDVMGDVEQQAHEKIVGAGLTGVFRYPHSVPPEHTTGYVISQMPSPGTVVPYRSTVLCVMSALLPVVREPSGTAG